jgi:hypothetical protein
VQLEDRWLSTPLQDAIRAGHTDCARLLAFSGATLGDSATDEDRRVCSITRMLILIVSSKGVRRLGLLHMNEKGMEFQRPTVPPTSLTMPRQLLRKVYSEDLASCEWEAVQVFQRKMTELQQRVARLLLAAACQHLRPEPERIPEPQ